MKNTFVHTILFKLTYYLPIAGKGRRDRFMPFLMVLAQSEMQIALSKIWTAMSTAIVKHCLNKY